MRLIAYTRVSTKDQSTDQQLDAIRGECQAHCHELVDIVTDHGASGKDLDRPGIQDALRRLGTGEADGLIVAKLDRLTRSVRDLDRLLSDCFARAKGPSYALVSVAERIDTDHAMGRFMLNVLMSVAQWEREVIGERTSDALQAKRRRNESTGRPPFGHRIAADGVHLEHDPGEQATIGLILDMRQTAGATQRAIVDHLRDEGITGRTGNPLSLVQVQRVLKRASVW